MVLCNTLTSASSSWGPFEDENTPGCHFDWSVEALTDLPPGCPSREPTRSWWSGPGPGGTRGTLPAQPRRAGTDCETRECCCSQTFAPLWSLAGPVSFCGGAVGRCCAPPGRRS